jgi:lipopolysaccharide transport system permease protein
MPAEPPNPEPAPCPSGSAVRTVTAAGRFAGGGGFLADWIADTRNCPRLAWRMFLRGFTLQYRHSALGVVLAFAPVLITALVIALGRRAQLVAADIDGVNSAFFAAFGILLAQAFVEGIGSTQRIFTGNAAFLKRQAVPIEAPLVAAVFDLAFRDLVRIAVIGVLMVTFAVPPSPWLPLAGWAILGISLAGGAIGLVLAPFSSLTSDLQVLTRALMIVVITTTPVFWVPTPESALGRLQAANPLSWAFDAVRAAAYGAPGSLAFAACLPVAALAFFLVGWFACRVARPHLLERMTGQGG